MGSKQLFSFLLTVITGTMFPGHIQGDIPVTEKSYEQVVLPSFVEGLNSLTSVAETLLASTNLQQGIKKVHQLLESSQESLSKAEESSLAQVKALSGNMEERLDKINSLNDDQKALETREQSLKAQIFGQQGQESIARQQLQASKDAVKNADDALERAIQAVHAAEADKNTAIGISFIPFAGLIAGPIMMNKAEAAMGRALNEAGEARRMKKIHMDSVGKYESQLQSYKGTIHSIEQTISANTEQIQVLHRNLNSERALYQKLNNFLIPLRKCTTFLSTLAGKTSSASTYVELSETLDGPLGVLDEIRVTLSPLVESSKDYSLLISDKLTTLRKKLEEVNRRLKKVAAS